MSRLPYMNSLKGSVRVLGSLEVNWVRLCHLWSELEPAQFLLKCTSSQLCLALCVEPKWNHMAPLWEENVGALHYVKKKALPDPQEYRERRTSTMQTQNCCSDGWRVQLIVTKPNNYELVVIKGVWHIQNSPTAKLIRQEMNNEAKFISRHYNISKTPVN